MTHERQDPNGPVPIESTGAGCRPVLALTLVAWTTELMIEGDSRGIASRRAPGDLNGWSHNQLIWILPESRRVDDWGYSSRASGEADR